MGRDRMTQYSFTKPFLAALSLAAITASPLIAGEVEHPKEMLWSFDGMTGTLDRRAAQRGFQVFKEVCAACHSMKRVAYRDLAKIGFTEPEIKALAAEKQVTDGPNDAGEMFERPARPSDHIVPPYANDKASRAANNGALPPDLSLIVKARHDGANYVYSLLTGYDQSIPGDMQMNEGMNYNPYFPGGQIAMASPLAADGQVSYEDGTSATIDQMARDVVTFLQWAAEPEMEARHRTGFNALIFIGILTVFTWLAYRRIWKDVQ